MLTLRLAFSRLGVDQVPISILCLFAQLVYLITKSNYISCSTVFLCLVPCATTSTATHFSSIALFLKRERKRIQTCLFNRTHACNRVQFVYLITKSNYNPSPLISLCVFRCAPTRTITLFPPRSLSFKKQSKI